MAAVDQAMSGKVKDPVIFEPAGQDLLAIRIEIQRCQCIPVRGQALDCVCLSAARP